MLVRGLYASVTFVVLLVALSPGASIAPAHASGPMVAASTASAPTGPGADGLHRSSATVLDPTASGRAATELRTLAELQSLHVPLRDVALPNFNAQVSERSGLIAPSYSQSPAPLGISSYGVENTTGNASGYVLNSPSYEGSVTFDSLNVLYFDIGDPDTIGVQMNTVTSNTTLFGNSNYSYWAQNVINYEPRTGLLQFFDNIWNFSSRTSLNISSNVFESYGPNGSLFYPVYYAANGPVFNVSMPFTVHLFLNQTTTNVNGFPDDILYFNYSVIKSAATLYSGSFDYVIFNSQNSASPTATIAAPDFQLNGFNPTASGFPYESELVLCGPYDGGTTTVLNVDASLNLWYLNSTTGTYENVPSAVAFGTNTGETIEGATEWFDASDTVHVGPGPTLPYPLWNASPAAVPGHIDLTGTITPDTSFVFLSQGTTFNPTVAGYAPVPFGGAIDYQVPAGNYTGEVLMSNYDRASINALQSNPTSWNVGVALTPDMTTGIYTPLIAYDNAELAELAVGGTGTSGNPYVLPNDAASSLDPLFGAINVYDFPEFPGLLISQTSAYVLLEGSSTFFINYTGPALSYMERYGLPTSNHLQFELYGTSHVSVMDTPGISGWLSENLAGLPVTSFMLWNATSTLIAGNVFSSQGTTLQLYGGTDNTIWGNWFDTDPSLANPAMATSVDYGSEPLGPQVYENADLIFNNAFLTVIPAYSPASTIYLATAYSTFSSTWLDAWNVSAQPATNVWIVNGISLTGSIVGGSYVGGNLWWDYAPGASVLPFGGFGLIAVGGDWLPIVGDSVTFVETGLPSGSVWGFEFDGLVVYASTPTVVLSFFDGSFNFSVLSIAGYADTPSNGTLVLQGGPGAVAIAFTLIPDEYLLTFTETGLPALTTWGVTVDGATQSAATTSIAFNVTDGIYTWSVAPVAGLLLQQGSGTTTIADANGSVEITFIAPPAAQFTIGIVETGLLAGTSWSATIAGVQITSNLDVISFAEPNGSYAYTIASVPGYSASATTGIALVTGAASNNAVAFTPLPVALSGTFSPTTATVWVDGAAVAPTAPGNFSVEVQPGTHALVVTALGYVTYYNNVSTGVGTPASVSIALNSVSSPTTTSTSGLTGSNLALLAGIAALALIFLIGMVYFWSRSRRPPMVMRPETTIPGSDPRPDGAPRS